MTVLPTCTSSLVIRVVAELLKGNHIKLPNGTIAMAEDLTIGYVYNVADTQQLRGSITLYDIVMAFATANLTVDDLPALVLSD